MFRDYYGLGAVSKLRIQMLNGKADDGEMER
jgi:hypothetical protein